MRGLGTIINALAIVIGGVLGILFKRFLKERYQDTIIKATGFSVVFLGAAGTLSKILTVRPDGTLSTGGSMVMILSLALGALLGELIDLDAQFERFGEWLKHKTGSAARCHDGSCGSTVRLYDDAVLNNLSLVGNILIFCVGINLVWPRTIKVANLLPSLLVAVALTGIL